MVLLSMVDFFSEFNFDDCQDGKRLVEECRYWFLRGWFDGLSDEEKYAKCKQFYGLVKRRNI